MCGIFCTLASKSSNKSKIFSDVLLPSIESRGPDACQHDEHHVTLNTGSDVTLAFAGSVLHLRGELTKQPLCKRSGDEVDLLLWNGEIFGGDVEVGADDNDTEVLFQRLTNIHRDESLVESLKSLFSSIHGPWSFIYYNSIQQKLWYARDYFGRRSLVCSLSEQSFCLSSVGHRMEEENFFEVPAKTLFCIDIKDIDLNNINDSIKEYPLTSPYFNLVQTQRRFRHRCTSNYVDVKKDTTNKNETGNENVSNLKIVSVSLDEKPTKCECVTIQTDTEPQQTFDELKGLADCTSVETKIEQYCYDHQSCRYCSAEEDISRITLAKTREMFLHLLEASVQTRVLNIPRCNGGESGDSKVGILFSGGIDSVILTALAHRFVPLDESIDLINVAFAQQPPKVTQHVKKKHLKLHNEHQSTEVHYNVPDRITGREAMKELPKDRRWNFIEVNVTLPELQEQRKETISNLVYPLESVLDDSIGCAIWFASRGKGIRHILKDGELVVTKDNYESPVKVLLTGMGADEQLGGYARHRTKFEKCGWQGLREEMRMEVERISSRNLGRDDRCISDHGKEARFPFLDEHVVAFLHELPVCVKCDPRLPRGEGEKILLREVAHSIGLHYVSKLPKRAIQFGSKIAKMEGGKEKGSDSCKRLK